MRPSRGKSRPGWRERRLRRRAARVLDALLQQQLSSAQNLAAAAGMRPGQRFASALWWLCAEELADPVLQPSTGSIVYVPRRGPEATLRRLALLPRR